MGILRKIFGKDTTTDVCDLLTLQHDQIDELMAQVEDAGGDRRAVFTQLADLLAAHATVEEKVFYPAIATKDLEDKLRESLEEHLSIKRLLADLITKPLDADDFKAKLKVLKEQLEHHNRKEEEDELFPKVRSLLASEQRVALGNELLVMFEDLMQGHPYQDVPAETAKAAPLPMR